MQLRFTWFTAILFSPFLWSVVTPVRPEIHLAGYLGGHDKDMGSAITVDHAGNVYIVGQTNSPDFPSTPGTVRTESNVNNNDWVGFAAKFRPDDRRPVYSTFIGGRYRSVANAVAADAAGNAFIVGTTCSADFPTTHYAFQPHAPGGGHGMEGCDAFVTKLDPTGSHFLYATYLGGSASDTATSVWVDPQDQAWVAGYTSSPDFPVSSDGRQRTLGGQKDGFLVELDAEGRRLLYGTFIGGLGDDIVQALAADSRQMLYLAGSSTSASFLPGAKREEWTAFVLPFSLQRGAPEAKPLSLSSSGFSSALALAVGANDDVYVSGITGSKSLPTSANAYQHRLRGETAAFWSQLRFNPVSGSLKPLYTTLVGGSYETSGDAISVAPDGAVTLGGWTRASDFPVTAQAFFAQLKRPDDAYLIRFAAAGAPPEFATFLGGGTAPTTMGMGVKGLAGDKQGNLYITGLLNGPWLRGNPGPLQKEPAGNTDPFVLGLKFPHSRSR